MSDIDIIGIDLGTTNSVIAVWDVATKQPRVLHNSEGNHLTPSLVALDSETDTFLVGETARRCMPRHPERIIYSMKRLMGRIFSDPTVRADQQNLTYAIDSTLHGRVVIRMGTQSFTPSEISARVLEKLRKDAEGVLARPVIKAVITVPAYFNEAQRQATKEAGEIAGLYVTRIINEPTAAALAFGLGAEPQTIVVYDMGGGTFDVSVLRIEHGLFRVKATGGDTHLGGDDFDMAIVQWMQEMFEQIQGIPLPVQEDPALRARLREEAERAKVALSKAAEYTIHLPELLPVNNHTPGLDITLTQRELAELILPYITSSLDICEAVLQEARLLPEHIDQVLLVGGQTRTPALRDALRERFGWKLNTSIDPDEAVGRGAAILGARLCGQLKEQVKLWDVIPLSLGIELADGRTEHILKANEQIPVQIWRKGFTTRRDGQEVIRFRVVQGERPLAKDNSLIGEVVLPLTTSRPKGEHRINCMFKVDQDGILHVRAEDADTEGDPVEAMFDHVYRLSPEEVDARLKEAETYKTVDQRAVRLLHVQNKAHQIRNDHMHTLAPDNPLFEQLDDLEVAIAAHDLERAERLLATIRSTP